MVSAEGPPLRRTEAFPARSILPNERAFRPGKAMDTRFRVADGTSIFAAALDPANLMCAEVLWLMAPSPESLPDSTRRSPET